MPALAIDSMGSLSGPAVGIVMKELVRRAIVDIRAQRASFEVQTKEGIGGKMDDVFTSADTRAQAIFVKSIQECFPNAGIIGEEAKLNIRPTNGCEIYFTIDPLDGTKAFIRRQSHAVGSMIAMVCNGEVLSAWIGDVNTQEIYGYRPDSDKVHRIGEYSYSQHLKPQTRHLSGGYLLLRDPLSEYSGASQELVDRFKSHQIDGGSIGIWLTRLWKHENVAALMAPGAETPWDTAPIVGISLKLGYVFMRPKGDGWEEYKPQLSIETTQRNHDTLIVHKSVVHEMTAPSK